MKHIGFNRLYYLMLALLLLAAYGCGSSGSSTAANDTGAVSAKLVWSDKSTGKTLAAVPPGSDVTTVKLTVSGTGTSGAPIPVVRSSFDAIANDSGTVSGVYPGIVTLTAQALNSAGVVRYEGAALNLVVTANATTDAGTIFLTPPLLKAQDASCTSCHETYLDNSGQNLVANFKQSGHYTNDSWTTNAKYGITGTGCAGCHGPQHNDADPSTSGRCYECHTTLGAKHQGGSPNGQYLTYTNNNCSACHEPHNPINGVGKQERKDWAESRHGEITGAAWSNRDFKNTVDCIRCHTTTGYVNYVNSGYTLPTVTWADPGDTTRQVLYCSACHTSNDFKNSIRPAGQYTAPYTNAPTQYPDAAASNLCLACHTGRQSGDTIKADADADGVRSFLNSHYLTAGGTVFAKSGFHFYSSASKLGLRDYAVTSGDDHQKIGIPGSTFSRTFNEVSSHTNGPCVGCHLTSGDGTHTFSPFTQGLTAGNVALNPMCANSCHTGRAPGGANENSANTWFGKDVTAADLVAGVSHVTHKGRLIGAYEALRAQLELRGIYFGEGFPYFFKVPYVAGVTTSADAFTDWQSVATALDSTSVASDGLWKSVMGTAFNYNLLVHDPGAVAHNRRYARRLVYDSIDFLDDGIMNRSVNATLTALPDTTAYKASALNYMAGVR